MTFVNGLLYVMRPLPRPRIRVLLLDRNGRIGPMLAGWRVRLGDPAHPSTTGLRTGLLADVIEVPYNFGQLFIGPGFSQESIGFNFTSPDIPLYFK